MCRLLGITNFEYSRHEEIVEKFCELVRTGMVMPGDPPGHEDGWGLAWYRDGKLAVKKSGGNLLAEKDQVIDTLRETGTTPVLILHLRKSAWSDTSSTRHAHPFHHDNVVFAHNGTVYDYKPLLADIKLPDLGEDALDTEVFFYHFLSAHVMSGGDLELGRAFLNTVGRIKGGLDFSALNCLFSDGRKLFAYRDYAREPEYYSLYKCFSGTSCLVSSEPLDVGLGWEMMEKGEFLEIAA